MKLNKFLPLLLTGFGFKVLAYEYQATCHENKLTKFENISVNQSTDECKAFLASGYATCFDSKKVNSSANLITISTPNDHYYKSKESTRYSRKTVQNIIDAAVKAGNDPYLALAIVLTENPPVVSNRKVVDGLSAAESYASDFGTVPLDAIAVADTMACDREANGYDSNGMVRVSNRSPRLRRFVDDPKGKDHFVCMENSITAGISAQFFLVTAPRADDCCVVVKTNAKDFIHEPIRDQPDQVYSYPKRELRSRLLDLLAQKYMQNRFQAAQLRAAGLRKPEEKMAMIAQSFNGFGKFGVGEATRNHCLHRVHMGTTPVYGAGASEIMINSLMNNSEIKGLVSDSLKRQNAAHPTSFLCSSYGSGTHQIEGYAFTNLLGGYLENRRACPRHSNKLKNLSKFTKILPAPAVLPEDSPSNDASESAPVPHAN